MWLPGVRLRHSVLPIEDCEGWWLSGCCGSVTEHWWLKPEVSCVRLPATASFFIFPYFHLITSKFLYIDSSTDCPLATVICTTIPV